MIRGLCRCLQYRNGLSERFVRNHWSTPSSSQPATPPTADKPAEQPQEVDFAESFKNLLPSPQFRKLLSDDKRKKLDNVIKQVELYCYMARKVPSVIHDDIWKELVDAKTVTERVCKLEYLAVKERREANDRLKSKDELFQQYMEEQGNMYNAGGMGYGPNLYELMSNPLRRKARINHEYGNHVCSSLRLADSPTIIMDMQYIFDGKHKGEFKIKKQLQYCITENMISRRPLPLLFSNVAKNEYGKAYMEKALGYWGGEYTDQMILPDYVPESPRQALIKSTGKKNPKIVYISNHAKKFLDGPLTADAYVFCASYDDRRESIIAAHKDKIDAYRLPIQRYVNWQQGPQVIPFPNLMRIFREVMESGGDWKSALHNNIAKRHLEKMDEDILAIRQSNKRNADRERAEVLSAITDAYGDN